MMSAPNNHLRMVTWAKRLALAATMSAMYVLRLGIGPRALLAVLSPGIVFVIVVLYLAFVAWAAARISGTRRETAMNVVLAALLMGSMLRRIRRGITHEQ